MLTLSRAENGIWYLNGQMTVDTITSVLPAMQHMISSNETQIVLDLSQVTRVDSGSVALLLEGLRLAKQASKIIQFVHYPQKMMDIIHVSNLEGLLCQ